MYPNFTLFCIPEGTSAYNVTRDPLPALISPQVFHKLSTEIPELSTGILELSTSYPQATVLARVLHKIPQGLSVSMPEDTYSTV